MVDIQSVTAEIRRGKKTEDTNHREKYKSSAVAEIDDRDHNRHGPNRGGVVPLSRGAGNPFNTMWTENLERWGSAPYGRRGLGPHLTQSRLG